MFDLTLVSPRSFFVPLPEASWCFFFRSKSGRAKRRLRGSESDSSEVLACERTESRGRLSRFGLIRRSAGCPASIRNPFVGPDLFFRRILQRSSSPKGIDGRKKSFFRNNFLSTIRKKVSNCTVDYNKTGLMTEEPFFRKY